MVMGSRSGPLERENGSCTHSHIQKGLKGKDNDDDD